MNRLSCPSPKEGPLSILPTEAEALLLVDLYRSAADDQARGRSHPTPAQLMIRLLQLMLRWFPDRSFVFVGDAGYGAHEVARFASRRRDRRTLVSQLHPDANLFEPLPPYNGKGRPRVKGARLPQPRQAVAPLRLRRRIAIAS